MKIVPQQIKDRIDLYDEKSVNIGEGWLNLVIDMDIELAKIKNDYKIIQIKEKMGLLRCYLSDKGLTPEEMSKLAAIVTQFEMKAADTCDVCGDKGEFVHITGFVATRCENHRGCYNHNSLI